jgi:hypothetical protein
LEDEAAVFTMKLRFLMAGLVAVILGIAFLVTRPSAIRGKFPGRFSDEEKRGIISLIHRDAYHQSVLALSHGEFKQTWRWIVNARKQEVYAVGNQPDGQIWVHVGVADKTQSEGYNLTARYFMKKVDGHWKITTLF